MVLGIALVGVLAGTAGGASPSAGADAPLQAMVLNTQFWPGANLLVLDLLDGDSVRLDPRDLRMTVIPTDPSGLVRDPIVLTPIQLVEGAPFRAEGIADLDQVGPWQLEVTADALDHRWSGTAGVEVWPDGGTPALGSVVPPTDTPTLESSGFHLASITTDPDPEPQLYWTSVADALAAGRPFVIAMDTISFKTSDSCGGALGELRHVGKEFPGLLLIHAEPWRMQLVDGALTLEPPGGPPVPAPWAEAWGVTTAPWIFVVDSEGRLRAKLTDVFGSDELRAAIRQISPWAPGGHCAACAYARHA